MLLEDANGVANETFSNDEVVVALDIDVGQLPDNEGNVDVFVAKDWLEAVECFGELGLCLWECE